MSFQLTIAEGKEAGKELVFEQDSVLIGRVAECDVVLYDAGISRRHCRIFADAGQYYVEDMGSSNGTRVNGTAVPTKEKQALEEGAQLSLGPVVFVFKPMSVETSEVPIPTEGDANSTRIVSLESVQQRQRNRAEVLAPEGADEQALEAARRSSTRTMPAQRARTGMQSLLPANGAPSLPPSAPARPPRGQGGSSSSALANASESAPAPRRPPAGGGAVAAGSLVWLIVVPQRSGPVATSVGPVAGGSGNQGGMALHFVFGGSF